LCYLWGGSGTRTGAGGTTALVVCVGMIELPLRPVVRNMRDGEGFVFGLLLIIVIALSAAIHAMGR